MVERFEAAVVDDAEAEAEADDWPFVRDGGENAAYVGWPPVPEELDGGGSGVGGAEAFVLLLVWPDRPAPS